MGSEIRHVPPGFQHPLDDEGYEIPGAHLEPLWRAGEASCTAFQLYENVTEGTSVSPIFPTREELFVWLRDEGFSEGNIEMLAAWGHAPSFIVRT